MSEFTNDPTEDTPEPVEPGERSPYADILQPGARIELTGPGQLAEFEEAIYPYVVADTYQPAQLIQSWEARTSLRSLLRPARFNGSIGAIELEVMDEPLKQLASARERYPKLLNLSGRVTNATVQALNVDEHAVLGFSLRAEARSSGRGQVGDIATDLWYLPPSKASMSHREPLRRLMAQPVQIGERLQKLDETSRQIGHNVLRYNLTHLYRHGNNTTD